MRTFKILIFSTNEQVQNLKCLKNKHIHVKIEIKNTNQIEMSHFLKKILFADTIYF